MCARFWRKKSNGSHSPKSPKSSSNIALTEKETCYRIEEKGGVTLFYPATNKEIFIPGGKLASGMSRKIEPYKPPPPCDSKHIPFKAWNGLITGLPGKLHQSQLSDLNVWLTLSWAPSIPWLWGITQEPQPTPHHIMFPITDYEEPSDVESFEWLVGTCQRYLTEGRNVHVSCVGGHGRTGLVLACIMGRSGITQPITHIREAGCEKWVESIKQIDFVSEFCHEKQKAKPRSYLTGGLFTHGTDPTNGNAPYGERDYYGPYSHNRESRAWSL
jgi:hypothetical protein